MSKIIGIDLGTTNSCVAVVEGGEAVVIPNAEGGRTTPSVVAFKKNGERIVGQTAKHQAVTNAERTISSIKRDMGSDRRIKIDDKRYSPQEISSMILAKLKADAEGFLGESVTDAVITVPAYFTDAQRQATKDAGTIAGLNVKRIINEPTAAALAYGIDKEEPQKIMVYDLGGGTFDVSILDINADVIQVLATAGNNHLGGDDFDKCLTDYMLTQFKKENGIDLSKDATAMERVKEAAEKAKIELSSLMATTVQLPFLSANRQGPVHMEMQIPRAKFNELTRHLVDATMDPLRSALSDSGMRVSDLSKVLLVGGSTRIPAVQEAVKSFVGRDPFKGINPDECVARGAALQGGVMGGEVKSLLLLDVMPLSLGLETVGNVFTPIIDRNTTIPVQHSQIFTTAAPFQTSVDIHVLQGERPIASENKELGKFRLSGIRRAMRGVPQIEVTFSIDVNGIVNVAAKDLGTGRRQEITITNSRNLSQEEIDRAIRDAERYAAEDAKRKEEAELNNRADTLQSQVAMLGKKVPKEDKKRLAEKAKQLKKAQKDKDSARMRSLCDEIEREIAALGENIWDADAKENREDGVTDAEYEANDDK